MEVPRKDLEEHATMERQWRTVHCDYCHEQCPKCQMEVTRTSKAVHISCILFMLTLFKVRKKRMSR